MLSHRCYINKRSATVMIVIIQTKLNNFIFGIQILWNTLISDFSQKGGGGGGGIRIISGLV